jgi:enamine deaminase RidA (YjgF/YER057c/UK114 family)
MEAKLSFERQRVYTGSPWEPRAGYCRCLRAGPFVFVAGTTATENGKAVHVGDHYRQAQVFLRAVLYRYPGRYLSCFVRSSLFR